MNPIEQYIHDRDEQVKKNMNDIVLQHKTKVYTEELVKCNYTKNFTWMGVPIIQYPGDLIVMQELIWKIRPMAIVECGIAFGGFTGFLYQMQSASVDGGFVLGIDIEIRKHTHEILDRYSRIKLIEKSSIDPLAVKEIRMNVPVWRNPIMVILDANHTHDHVLQELKLYSPLVSVGSYIVIFDTAIEFYGHLDKNQGRPWGKGNNPYTSVQEFLKDNDEFVVDREVEQRAGITAAPGGYLRRIK